MKIALSTDTSCTISKELACELNVFVFPLNVIIDGNEFIDGITINHDKLRNYMRENRIIKTSTPPSLSVIEYFNDIFSKGYDYIVHFTISSKLSSMNQLFENISNTEFDNKIIVIDSLSVCSQMLSHVIFAREAINNGINITEIQELVNQRNLTCETSFIPENLTALKNGGRISPTIATIGNIIGLKPVIALKKGELVKETMTRNVKKTFIAKLDVLFKNHSINEFDYSIVAFDSDEKILNLVKKYIEQYFGNYQIKIQSIAINVCAHCGPGTIGLLVTPKIYGKSIYDYIK